MGTVTRLDVCPRCSRPLPHATYKVEDSDLVVGCVIGFLAFCLAMGFGVSFWHGIVVLIVGAYVGASAEVSRQRRKFERRRAGL